MCNQWGISYTRVDQGPWLQFHPQNQEVLNVTMGFDAGRSSLPASYGSGDQRSPSQSCGGLYKQINTKYIYSPAPAVPPSVDRPYRHIFKKVPGWFRSTPPSKIYWVKGWQLGRKTPGPETDVMCVSYRWTENRHRNKNPQGITKAVTKFYAVKQLPMLLLCWVEIF